MSARRGLTQRRTGDWRLLQARVAPGLKAEAEAAALASGVSFSLYVELLMERARVENGKLPIIHVSTYKQEELPIPTD